LNVSRQHRACGRLFGVAAADAWPFCGSRQSIAPGWRSASAAADMVNLPYNHISSDNRTRTLATLTPVSDERRRWTAGVKKHGVTAGGDSGTRRGSALVGATLNMA